MDERHAQKVDVYVRVRPPRADGGGSCVSAEGGDAGAVLTQDSGSERQGKTLRFHFSQSFFWDALSTTRHLHEVVGRHLLAQALSGYNCALLAYGQTGKGARRRKRGPRTRHRACASFRA